MAHIYSQIEDIESFHTAFDKDYINEINKIESLSSKFLLASPEFSQRFFSKLAFYFVTMTSSYKTIAIRRATLFQE